MFLIYYKLSKLSLFLVNITNKDYLVSKPQKLKLNDKTGLRYWHFWPEIESFQRASSLQGPRPLAITLEHIRGGVVLITISESSMGVPWLHTQ